MMGSIFFAFAALSAAASELGLGPRVTSRVLVASEFGTAGATWGISCLDGSTFAGTVPYDGKFTAASTTACHIRIDDPAGNGGITWSGYNFEVSLALSKSHKEHTFSVCSFVCCTSDASGEEVCACRHPDADSCQPELQPAFVPT